MVSLRMCLFCQRLRARSLGRWNHLSVSLAMRIKFSSPQVEVVGYTEGDRSEHEFHRSTALYERDYGTVCSKRFHRSRSRDMIDCYLMVQAFPSVGSVLCLLAADQRRSSSVRYIRGLSSIPLLPNTVSGKSAVDSVPVASDSLLLDHADSVLWRV